MNKSQVKDIISAVLEECFIVDSAEPYVEISKESVDELLEVFGE